MRGCIDTIYSEMIDRFGLLPTYTKNLFGITELKLTAQKLEIIKIATTSQNQGIIEFAPTTKIEPKQLMLLIQKDPNSYKFAGAYKIAFTFKPDITKIDFINKLLNNLTESP